MDENSVLEKMDLGKISQAGALFAYSGARDMIDGLYNYLTHLHDQFSTPAAFGAGAFSFAYI